MADFLNWSDYSPVAATQVPINEPRVVEGWPGPAAWLHRLLETMSEGQKFHRILGDMCCANEDDDSVSMRESLDAKPIHICRGKAE